MIKASGEEGISIYHKLCTKIWKEEKWPSERTKAVFVPIPKKGDLQQCTNYRTIALISHTSKILLKIIMKRLQRKLDKEINQTQAGFRQNCGTRDQIFNLPMLVTVQHRFLDSVGKLGVFENAKFVLKKKK